MPITGKPENIAIVVAGGERSRHNYWMQVGAGPTDFVSAEVQLPAGNWEELLRKAKEELGPRPD